MVRITAVAAAIVLTALLLTSSALGASACASAVLRDWSHDGRVAPTYSLPCYEEAIDALPTDIRDYTNAEDAITRALSSAVRVSSAAQPVNESQADPADRGAPFVLVGLAGVALAMLCAGSVGYLARRRRAADRSDDGIA